MGRVLTNAVTLQVAVETALGVQPVTGWKLLEPTTISKYGPSLKKLTRAPISKNRQRRKGSLTDLDSTVEFDVDVTWDHLNTFAPGIFCVKPLGAPVMVPTAVTATGYTVAAGPVYPDGTIVFASGFPDAQNNGLKVLAGATNISLAAPGLVANPVVPPGATVAIAGIQGAAADIAIDANGDLTSTALNWLTNVTGALLEVGQFIWIGDVAGGANSFATAADRGLARVTAKAAGKLTLDKKSTVFVADPGAAKQINIYFGQFYKTVPTDDANYQELSYQFELAYQNLDVGGGAKYEYAEGNYANELTFDIQAANKATMKAAFVGTDCPAPTNVRAGGAGAATPPIGTTMFNTSSDFMRLRITDVDETGLTTDFKKVTLSIKNNASPEKVIGTVGGKYMNLGMIDVEMDADMLFTDSTVIDAMRNNDTVTGEVCMRNDDGAFLFDLPAMTVEGGDKGFPVNQTVTVSLKAPTFQDPSLGTSLSLSTFPYMPAS